MDLLERLAGPLKDHAQELAKGAGSSKGNLSISFTDTLRKQFSVLSDQIDKQIDFRLRLLSNDELDEFMNDQCDHSWLSPADQSKMELSAVLIPHDPQGKIEFQFVDGGLALSSADYHLDELGINCKLGFLERLENLINNG